jgi:DNA-binding NarL/FixJ family response regulator
VQDVEYLMPKYILLYIVEDEKDDVDLLLSACEGEDWLKVRTYSTTESAVRGAKKQPPDVLSLDLLFGESFLGFWAMHKTRTADPAVGIIVVSEHPGKKEEAADQKVDCFVTKDQIREDPRIYPAAIKRVARRRVQSTVNLSFKNIIAIDPKLGAELVSLSMTEDMQTCGSVISKMISKKLPEGIAEYLSSIRTHLEKSEWLNLNIPILLRAIADKRLMIRWVYCTLPARCVLGRKVILRVEIKPQETDKAKASGLIVVGGEHTKVLALLHGDGFQVEASHIEFEMKGDSKPIKLSVFVRPIIIGTLRLTVDFFVHGSLVGSAWTNTEVED